MSLLVGSAHIVLIVHIDVEALASWIELNIHVVFNFKPSMETCPWYSSKINHCAFYTPDVAPLGRPWPQHI
jgi:hypothetical protein